MCWSSICRATGDLRLAGEESSIIFEAIARQIIGVLDEEGILRPHLVSMSLGALLAEEVAALYPDRVRTLVLAGGIAGLSWWALLLMHAGRAVSPVVPYIGLYRLFAWIMMPGRTHAETRRLFTVHAARLGRGGVSPVV